MTSTARLLVQCPDGRGITAAVTAFIAERGGNLLDLEQHTEEDVLLNLALEFRQVEGLHHMLRTGYAGKGPRQKNGKAEVKDASCRGPLPA